MQKIATRVFIVASVIFGILGVIFIVFIVDSDRVNSTFGQLIIRALFSTVFIILPSFALSVASKYLNSKS